MKEKQLKLELSRLNSDLIDYFDIINGEIDLDSMSYFKSVGIEVPLPLQAMAYNFCTGLDFKGRWLL